MRQYVLMHGDLPAYDILHRHRQIAIVDFSEVTYILASTNKCFILKRHIERIYEFFARQRV